MFLHDWLACLDIETVPDTEVLPADHDPAAFPKLPFHRVVAISMVEAEIVREPGTGAEWYRVVSVKSGGREDYTEAQLLASFWRWFARRRPRVVTWNGRAFDIPVLKLRALVHGVGADCWHTAGDGRFASYGYRYAPDWHCDLMDVLGDFGAARGLGLDDVARAMGLPGKIGGHGSEVAEMLAEGRIGDIRAYCEGDVLNLMALYVRWALMAGRTGAAGHNASMRSLVECLERDRAERPHLGAFLDRWNASARPAPMLVPEPTLARAPGPGHLASEHVLGG